MKHTPTTFGQTAWTLETYEEVAARPGHPIPDDVGPGHRRLRLFGRIATGEPYLPLSEQWIEGELPAHLEGFLKQAASFPLEVAGEFPTPPYPGAF